MRVLFLDIDGVLISQDSMLDKMPTFSIDESRYGDKLSKPATDLLFEIIKQYDFKVVLSSSWRLHELDLDLVDQLFAMYRQELYDVTSDFGVYSQSKLQREDEIQAWVDKHPEVTQFIYLEDDARDTLKDHLVKTNWQHGLLPEHKDRIKEIMGE